MLLAQFFFAAMNVCTRLGGRDLRWAEVGAARFLVGALMAGALGWYQRSSLRITDGNSAWRRSIFGALSALCTFYALASDRIALGDVATLSATAPIFVAVLSGPLLGERVGMRMTLAISLVFGGVVAVVGPSFGTAAPVAAVAISGAILYALAMIWLRAYSLHRAAPLAALSGREHRAHSPACCPDLRRTTWCMAGRGFSPGHGRQPHAGPECSPTST
jgi:drug/metabolite transporter (DMT)-like permease